MVVEGILKWLMMAADMLGVGLLQQRQNEQVQRARAQDISQQRMLLANLASQHVSQSTLAAATHANPAIGQRPRPSYEQPLRKWRAHVC